MAKASAAKTGTDTVTVALKYPPGLVLTAYEKTEEYEDVRGGGKRKVDVFLPTGDTFTLNGNRVPVGVTPNFDIRSGYAMTRGVPKDLWETWLEQNKRHNLVTAGLIFAVPTGDEDSIKDRAKDGAKIRHGLEPMALKGDPRVPMKKNKEGKFVEAIETATEQATN